jgi:hypothetical protein
MINFQLTYTLTELKLLKNGKFGETLLMLILI